MNIITVSSLIHFPNSQNSERDVKIKVTLKQFSQSASGDAKILLCDGKL